MYRSTRSTFQYQLAVLSVTFNVGMFGLTPTASRAQGSLWDLAKDFSVTNNPNGAWTYGAYADAGDTVFAAFTAESANDEQPIGPAWYSPNGNPGGDIIINTHSTAVAGISPGQVSLHADAGTPVARWTSPTAGTYTIDVMIGGTQSYEGIGTGNADAYKSA